MAKKGKINITVGSTNSMTIENKAYNIPSKMWDWGQVAFDAPIDAEILASPNEFLSSLDGTYQEQGTVLNCILFLSKRFLEIMGPEIFKNNNPDSSKLATDFNKIITFFGDKVDEVNIENGKFSVSYSVNNEEEKKEVIQEVDAILKGDLFLKILSQVPKKVWGVIQQNQDYAKLKKENEKLKEEAKKREGRRHTRIAIHTVTQFYGDNKQLSIFSDEKIDAFAKATGLNVNSNDRPDSYGVFLNQSQRKVLEGILKAFSDINYKGDKQKEKVEALGEIYSDTEASARALVKGDNAPYKNIDKIPVVRLTQAKIIDLSGYDLKSQRQGDKVDVVDAINFLATKQFCFYWVRKKTEGDKLVKDKNGDWVNEEVMEVGSLFRIKTVRTEGGELQYYEIHPSAPLLDQVNNYFLLVPSNWRDEVKQKTGKGTSSYTYALLLWLRLQYEQKRRYNKVESKTRKPKPFTISKSWEEVAVALRMPPTVYKANRKRGLKIIQEAYSVAIELGYLVKVENNGATDVLYLNQSYYPKPGELV